MDRARRYVSWLRRNSFAIIACHAVALAAAIYLVAYQLPLYADFSYLLPQDVAAVKDLRKLEARVKTADTVLVVVKADSNDHRAAAVKDLTAGLGTITSTLVDQVDADDAEVRAFLHDHRQVLVPLAELEHARDALRRRIEIAKLRANPLFVDLGDADDARDRRELHDLREKRREVEAKLDHPSNISVDGRIALIQVRTSFPSTDIKHGEALSAALDAVRTRVIAVHPGVAIGFTGGVIVALDEHHAISQGIVVSGLVTTVLVALVLVLYFRSATLLVLLVGTIGVATAVAFGAAVFTVGHLNAATAFLGAIIAGNGINYGILLIARYLEERRSRDVDESIARAIACTLRPTAIASLGAAIAYGSLAATSFKGFADFAVIGAIGMLLCWIASYTLLPTLMLRFGRRTRIYHGAPIVGSTLVRVLGFKRSRLVLVAAAIGGVAAISVVVRYVAADPFEYDIKQLRSDGRDAAVAREWMALSDATFGRGFSGRTIIAADRREEVPLIVDALRDSDRGRRFDKQTFGSIESIETIMPPDQPQRLAVLAEIRALVDDDALSALDDHDRAELAELRPPDHVEPITIANLPHTIAETLTEKDGSVGNIVSIGPSTRLDEWNGHDLIRFAKAVRELHLRDGATVTSSGASVIFADIMSSIGHDGPKVTAVAAAGLVLMVVLLVGRNRRSIAVLCATVAGSLLMVATCALLGLHINFLDFVALPITLGLGIDYAINVAHRHDHDDTPDPIATLRTSGSAVFVCSLTTIIGYGSLLVSENLAIRGFGTASLIGEVTCVLAALVLVPALLAVLSTRPAASSAAPR